MKGLKALKLFLFTHPNYTRHSILHLVLLSTYHSIKVKVLLIYDCLKTCAAIELSCSIERTDTHNSILTSASCLILPIKDFPITVMIATTEKDKFLKLARDRAASFRLGGGGGGQKKKA